MNTYRSAFIFTSKDTPHDAEVVSHQLMIRAGMIKKLASGVYAILPLGQRVFDKMTAIIQKEMTAIGGMACHLPASVPSKLWEASGRWEKYGNELLRFQDRHGRWFCFSPTHEEVITNVVASYVSSYKQLPLLLYQIQTKFRDEIRPRFGLMRCREFLMKDAYSFHDTPDSLDAMYESVRQAYRAIFHTCGLRMIEAVADSGAIGGESSMEFLVTAESGEDDILLTNDGQFSANVEACECVPIASTHSSPSSIPAMTTVHTPNKKRMDDVATYLDVATQDCIKTMVVMVDNAPHFICLPGDRSLNEVKLGNVLNRPFRLASPTEIQTHVGCSPGFVGPIHDAPIPIILDTGLAPHAPYCCGINRDDTHAINVVLSRDVPHATWADVRRAIPGDPSPIDPSQSLVAMRGIEVGHIFKLGTTYSESMGAHVTGSDGKPHPLIMGCYGIGVGRTIAAAIEQHHDDKGIIWPPSLAPFHVVIIHLCPNDVSATQVVTDLYDAIYASGYDAIVDDRTESPGVKFKDADLIGFPYQITVGPRSMAAKVIDITRRRDGTVQSLPMDDRSRIGSLL